MFLRTKLSVMMFLQFFIWGAWFPPIFAYLPSLGFTPMQQSAILWTFNISAIIAMFFSNQFADRRFAAEKFLSFSQFVGGLGMLGLFFVRSGWTTEISNNQINLSFVAFFALMALHTLLYVPTISITNSIAFANLTNPQKEFGPVRLWGTIGWIAAQWPFIFILVNWTLVPNIGQFVVLEKIDNSTKIVRIVPEDPQQVADLQRESEQKSGIFSDGKHALVKTDALMWLKSALGTPKTGEELLRGTRYAFLASGIASLLLALFSLLLPNTPPKSTAEAGGKLAWVEALKLLRHPFVLILFFVTFLDATVHQLYFSWTFSYLEKAAGIPGNWVQPVMSIGQVAEILTMAILGFVLKSLGWRMTMIIGILGHMVRFGVFAFYPEPIPAIAVNLLHGICYAFFFATVYIFVDEYFPKDIRASAQGLFNLLILGVGPLVGNFIGPRLLAWFDPDHADPNRFQKLFGINTFSVFLTANDTKEQFRNCFLVPASLALFAALILLLFFHPPKKKEQ